jgi:hypothetical protein
VPDTAGDSRTLRRLAAALEPCIGQVYFAPEAHAAYAALGFAASPGAADGVALPDGPAYFTSRGSLLGAVAPTVVAAAFAVFNPAVVAPCVAFGWTLTDAATIFAVRREAGVAQLLRTTSCTPDDEQLGRAAELLQRATEPLRPEGRPLFAGARDHYDDPADAATRLFHLGDMLREYRGDSHTAAWVSADVDATEIGLLTEVYIGIPPRTYVRTRAWSDAELDAASERLAGRGWVTANGTSFTAEGRAAREAIEVATDAQLAPVLAALGGDADELIALLEPWGAAVRAARGYVGSAADLWPNR